MADDENIWKRLTRLFRSGPTVRHKFAAAEPVREPSGTAKAYKRQISSLYVSSMAAYGQFERMNRYNDYNEMCYTPEIASALDIYAEEICSEDDNGNVITITSSNEEIKQILETLFYDVIDINFNGFSWNRNLCKNGDFALFVDATEENGIVNLLPIPINELEREEGYDPKDPFAVRYRWKTQNNAILQNWQIIHFRLLGDDSFLPYGYSILEPARRIWRQLVLIEDAMLVYRIVRSPERRVFRIPVGNITAEEIPAFMEQVKNEMKRNQIVDPSTGRVDLRYNPLSVDEDYFLPMRGDQGPTIDSLPGGQFTGDIDDVKYIQSKVFAALKIPKAYLNYDEDVGSKSTLAQEDVRFAKTISRIKKIWVAELNKIAIIHLFLMGYEGDELTNFEIKATNSSYIAEQQKLELWRMRFEVAGMATEGIFDRKKILKDIFRQNDDEINEIQEGRKLDRLFDLTLEGMQAPGGQPEGGPGGPGDEEADVPGTALDTGDELPGEDQLPDTLGGKGGGETINAGLEVGGGVIGEAEGEPGGPGPGDRYRSDDGRVFVFHSKDDDGCHGYWEDSLIPTGDVNDSRTMRRPRETLCVPEEVLTGMWERIDDPADLDEVVLPEKFNPGSSGDRAELAVDKGKNLFSTHDDLFTSVFGTEKQTASDPYDTRAMRRAITRPLGETAALSSWYERRLEGAEMLERAIRRKAAESENPRPRGRARGKKILR